MLWHVFLNAFLYVVLPLWAVGFACIAAALISLKRWNRIQEPQDRAPRTFHLVQL